jgi:hypothetical protein
MAARVSSTGRQCEHVNAETGEQCKAWATRATFDDEEGPRCRVHALAADPKALSREMSRMAKAGGVKRRGDVEPSPRAEIDPSLTFRDVARVCREALSATFEHNGQPDLGARLAACAVLLLAFPRYTRPTVAEAQRLLAEIVPATAHDEERLGVEEAFRALRAEWWALPAWHPVRGLVARELPRELVPPWEDYSTVVRREAPKDIAPSEAKARIVRLNDGDVALRHEGQLPRLLETVG